ncbi:protein kish-B isoform X1 [Falco biarmicus]|uniref:protein kish-B isoform X1 n=1 Tax=Falco biarmicus TaxID=345155 RepID=UPI0024BC9009|nr:protein kish-B isoform X1 [Falco biarmicus]
MTNVYSLDGLLVFGLLLVCTCAYLRKVPRLKAWLLSEKRGVWGVFYKAQGTFCTHPGSCHSALTPQLLSLAPACTWLWPSPASSWLSTSWW